MENELRPCPFCGGNELVLEKSAMGRWSVVCIRCESQGNPSFEKRLSIKSWNTRTLPPAVQGVVEAARELMWWDNNALDQDTVCNEYKNAVRKVLEALANLDEGKEG